MLSARINVTECAPARPAGKCSIGLSITKKNVSGVANTLFKDQLQQASLLRHQVIRNHRSGSDDAFRLDGKNTVRAKPQLGFVRACGAKRVCIRKLSGFIHEARALMFHFVSKPIEDQHVNCICPRNFAYVAVGAKHHLTFGPFTFSL